ncbi:type 2 periplasmic-binding domain-containing protein [Marinobacterium jannaschii]|uniref:hypothetical protein n=1 Tax=Marinobacterium jannaschii TaxID=64970 RepID=UPI000685376E|nr:hypothetical protein [Marinobacterium jannaschii]
MSMSLNCRQFSRIASISVALFVLILSSHTPLALAGSPAPPVVIVNPSVDVDFFSDGDLWAIFGVHYRAWPDGSAVKVFVLPDKHPVHRSFAIKRLHTYPYQLKRVWKRLAFSGTGRAPYIVKDQQEMLLKVSSTPGAIGYVDADFDTGESHVLIVTP